MYKKSDLNMVFIGGAMDSSHGAMKSVEKKLSKIADRGYNSFYYYWTGKHAALPVSGEFEISSDCIKKSLTPLCIVGHSFGGDTGYKVCQLLARKDMCVDLLITLDAVSPVGHFVNFKKPKNVCHWINVWSSGTAGWNNNIALFGGRWGRQLSANADVCTTYDHVDATSMFYQCHKVTSKVKSLLP